MLNIIPIILVHFNAATRHQRLYQERNQPELVNDNMDNWSNYLRNQAIQKNVLILDTTLMTIDEMDRWLKKYIDSLIFCKTVK